MEKINEKFKIRYKNVYHNRPICEGNEKRDMEKSKNNLFRDGGGDKIVNNKYNKIYDKYLEFYIGKNINLLEIGILEGDGLLLFSEY